MLFLASYGEGGFIKISNESQQPMQAIASEFVLVNSHGFTSAIGLRKNKHWSWDGLRPTYVNAKSNHKCNSELIDLLNEVLFIEMLGLD